MCCVCGCGDRSWNHETVESSFFGLGRRVAVFRRVGCNYVSVCVVGGYVVCVFGCEFGGVGISEAGGMGSVFGVFLCASVFWKCGP